jgi:hypothetical protein
MKTDDATSPGARARITGIVYLLCFLTTVSDEVFVGRSRLVVFDSSVVSYLSVVSYQPASVAHPLSATVSGVSGVPGVSAETLEVVEMPPSRIRRARAACWQSTQTPSS